MANWCRRLSWVIKIISRHLFGYGHEKIRIVKFVKLFSDNRIRLSMDLPCSLRRLNIKKFLCFFLLALVVKERALKQSQLLHLRAIHVCCSIFDWTNNKACWMSLVTWWQRLKLRAQLVMSHCEYSHSLSSSLVPENDVVLTFKARQRNIIFIIRHIDFIFLSFSCRWMKLFLCSILIF